MQQCDLFKIAKETKSKKRLKLKDYAEIPAVITAQSKSSKRSARIISISSTTRVMKVTILKYTFGLEYASCSKI